MFRVFFLYPFILLLTYHPDLSSPNIMPCFHFSDRKPREPAPLVQPHSLPRRTLITNSGFVGLFRGFMFPKCRILLFDSFYIFQWHCPVLQTLFFHSFFWRQCCGDVPGLGTWPPGGRRLLASCPTSWATNGAAVWILRAGTEFGGQRAHPDRLQSGKWVRRWGWAWGWEEASWQGPKGT